MLTYLLRLYINHSFLCFSSFFLAVWWRCWLAELHWKIPILMTIDNVWWLIWLSRFLFQNMLSSTINALKTRTLQLPRSCGRCSVSRFGTRFGRVSAFCLLIASQSVRMSSSSALLEDDFHLKKQYSNITLLGQKEAIQIDGDLYMSYG